MNSLMRILFELGGGVGLPLLWMIFYWDGEIITDLFGVRIIPYVVLLFGLLTVILPDLFGMDCGRGDSELLFKLMPYIPVLIAWVWLNMTEQTYATAVLASYLVAISGVQFGVILFWQLGGKVKKREGSRR